MDLFSRCCSGIVADCKIGRAKGIKVKVGREDGLGRRLGWGRGGVELEVGREGRINSISRLQLMKNKLSLDRF